MTRVLIFEDTAARQLRPLTWTRPAWALRSGIVTLAEKIAAAYPGAEVLYHARPHVAAVATEETCLPVISGADDAALPAGPLLCINGRVIAGSDFARLVPPDGPPQRILSGDCLVAVRLTDGRDLARAMTDDGIDAAAFIHLPDVQAQIDAAAWPWDLVSRNAREIEADFARFCRGGCIEGAVHPSAVLEGRDRIWVGEGAVIQPGAVLMADEGPIAIGPGAIVMPGAFIQGPASIGEGSRVKAHAKIYEGTTAGPLCKVGGEIEASILQGFSNKQHDGFMGHSYLGAWCNLGADTNTSDLKNTYSSVTVTLDGHEVDTGSMFVGLLMGDHSKTGINVMFNAGTVVGVGCNLFGSDYQRKEVPSFTWGGRMRLGEHEFKTFCATAETVISRRGRDLSAAAREMLQRVFEMTGQARAGATRRGTR